ncbi:Serine/threonine-protein phosphatase 4 regulatory subunit 2 [Chamberlinius hualienensis]
MMEHATKETIFDELNNFEKKKPYDVPVILEEYLNFIAKTGDIVFPWQKLKPLFKCKLDRVIRKFKEDYPVDDMPYSQNVEKFSFEDMHSKLLNTLEEFSGAPFTIQRLCELVVHPDKHYKRVDKFLRALEKDLLVVSTIEPVSRRPTIDGDSSPVVNGVTEIGYSNSVNGVNPDSPIQSSFVEDSNETSADSTFTADTEKLNNEHETVNGERKDEENNLVHNENEQMVYSSVETCISLPSSSSSSIGLNDRVELKNDLTCNESVGQFIDKCADEVDEPKNSDKTSSNFPIAEEMGEGRIPEQEDCQPDSVADSSSRSEFECEASTNSVSESNHDLNMNPINSEQVDSSSVTDTTVSSGYGDSNESITDSEPMEQE